MAVRTADALLESAGPAAPAASKVNGLDDRKGRSPGLPAAERKEERSSVRREDDLSAMSNAAAIASPADSSASAAQISEPSAQEATSLDVVHLHRVGRGSCEGRLVVSRDGVAFVPDRTTSR